MVKIRFARTGRKNHATFKVVAIDSRSARDSRAIEDLGHYLPHTKEFKVNQDRVQYWLSVGAQPSETVARQLIKLGLLDKSAVEVKKYVKTAGEKSQGRKDAKAEKAAEAAKPKEEPVVEEAPVAEVPAEASEEPAEEAAPAESE
jgi:small subunit ribosomal protein S16